MLTNQLIVEYNMKNIDRDFDIFLVEKSNKDYYKYNILDSPKYEFKALAIQWSFGARALVLFKKDEVGATEFKNSLREKHTDVKVTKIDLANEEMCKKYFGYNNRLLLQLLANSLTNYTNDKLMYNNLTGKLLYHDARWDTKEKDENKKPTGKFLYKRFAEIVIDPQFYLNVDMISFKRYNDENGTGLYVVDPTTKEFRKKLSKDKGVDIFRRGAPKNRRFTIDSIKISSYNAFRRSKLGIMQQFMNDFREKLSDYVKLKFTRVEEDTSIDIPDINSVALSCEEYGAIINGRKVVIVDENHTPKSEEVAKIVKNELQEVYKIEASIGELSREAYNIRIIHNEEYYLNNEESDPHNDDLSGYIVQHLTEEISDTNSEEVDKSAYKNPIKKIVQELVIKNDIYNNQIAMYDWKKASDGKVWTYITREEKKVDKSTQASNEKRGKERIYRYYRLIIDSSGKMKFDTFLDDATSVYSNEWKQVCMKYDQLKEKHYGNKDEIDGLIYSDINNIQAILRTRKKVIPNIENIYDTLKQTYSKDKISKENILIALEDFEGVYNQYAAEVNGWKNDLYACEDNISRQELKQILVVKKKVGKAGTAFNRFMFNEYGIRIFEELRCGDFDSEYQLSSILNIKCMNKLDDYLDGNAVEYCVGAKGPVNVSYGTACCVRKIIALDGEIQADKLIPLMAVDFVRNGQYTVLPFPFKYLREYIEQM